MNNEIAKALRLLRLVESVDDDVGTKATLDVEVRVTVRHNGEIVQRTTRWLHYLNADESRDTLAEGALDEMLGAYAADEVEL